MKLGIAIKGLLTAFWMVWINYFIIKNCDAVNKDNTKLRNTEDDITKAFFKQCTMHIDQLFRFYNCRKIFVNYKE